MIMPAAARFMIGNTVGAYGHHASVILELRVILKCVWPRACLSVPPGADRKGMAFRHCNHPKPIHSTQCPRRASITAARSPSSTRRSGRSWRPSARLSRMSSSPATRSMFSRRPSGSARYSSTRTGVGSCGGSMVTVWGFDLLRLDPPGRVPVSVPPDDPRRCAIWDSLL
jgi:hypothetical protein